MCSVRRQVFINGYLSQQRARELQQRIGQQKDKSDEYSALVRQHVREQPPHNAAVICFAYYFLFHNSSLTTGKW